MYTVDRFLKGSYTIQPHQFFIGILVCENGRKGRIVLAVHWEKDGTPYYGIYVNAGTCQRIDNIYEAVKKFNELAGINHDQQLPL